MALSTTVTPWHVSVAIGQPTPTAGSVTFNQWQMWISDALLLVQDRATDIGVLDAAVSQAKLDYAIREVVADQVRRAGDTDTTPDEYRYRSIQYFWPMLGLTTRAGKAFEVDTAANLPGVYGEDYWWSTPVNQVPIP